MALAKEKKNKEPILPVETTAAPVAPPAAPTAAEAPTAAAEAPAAAAPVTKEEKAKRVRKPKEKKAPAPPQHTIWGVAVSEVVRALGQQTDAKAKVICQFVVSKGIPLANETIARQALRARRALQPGYEGCGENGYYKLGKVPTLTAEQKSEFAQFAASVTVPVVLAAAAAPVPPVATK